ERAHHAMEKALENDPNYALRHWAAANLYVRLGDKKAAEYELRRTAELDDSYTLQVLDLVWALYSNPGLIMAPHVPNTKQASLVALNFFMQHQSLDGAEIAWDRLKAFDTKLQERFGYIDYLISQNKPHEAWDVFAAGLPAPDRNAGPPLFNSDF